MARALFLHCYKKPRKHQYRKMNLLLLGLVSLCLGKAFDNGVGYSPQMGWNSWNKYGCNINESIIVSTAEKMKKLGLADYGYEYVVMDDCYALPERDNDTGKIGADPEKFPNGIEHLTNKIHELGFKFGMYSSAGKFTCGGYPGSLHNEELDAQTFADWGIDYLKYDNCYNDGLSGTPQVSSERYRNMSDALNSTGRTIFFSLCQWGQDNVWEWGTTVANSWRISGDITDSFNKKDDRCPCETYECSGIQGFKCSMVNILEKSIPIGQKAGPFNGWNDMDSLEVGNGGMTTDEYKSHFTLWAILKSPLVLGNDVTNMTDVDFAIVTNRDIIAINQDNSAVAYRVYKEDVVDGRLLVFINTLSDKSVVVTLFNSGSKNETTTLEFDDILPKYKQTTFEARELWTNNTETFSGKIEASVGKHLIKIWRLQQK